MGKSDYEEGEEEEEDQGTKQKPQGGRFKGKAKAKHANKKSEGRDRKSVADEEPEPVLAAEEEPEPPEEHGKAQAAAASRFAGRAKAAKATKHEEKKDEEPPPHPLQPSPAAPLLAQQPSVQPQVSANASMGQALSDNFGFTFNPGNFEDSAAALVLDYDAVYANPPVLEESRVEPPQQHQGPHRRFGGMPSEKDEEDDGGWDPADLAQAKTIAAMRRLYAKEEPGKKGPFFQRNIWEFYRSVSRWSDSTSVAFGSFGYVCFVFVPFLWPVRLIRTMQRAVPFRARLCLCGCPLGNFLILPTVLMVFAIPFAMSMLLLAPAQHELNRLMLPVDITKEPLLSPTYVFLICLLLVVLGSILTIFWWARLLLGIAIKYNIGDAMDSPNAFMQRTTSCICVASVRIGLHVDRAQGFEKPVKSDMHLVTLSDKILATPPQRRMSHGEP